MHLVYSAISVTENTKPNKHGQLGDELLRYHAYLEVCNKYSREIAEIQKRIPDWAPKFR
jgi:hypothetical protein